MSWEVLFEPFAAKSECSKVLIDSCQQGFGLRVTDGYVWLLEVLHVMTAIEVIINDTLSS